MCISCLNRNWYVHISMHKNMTMLCSIAMQVVWWMLANFKWNIKTSYHVFDLTSRLAVRCRATRCPSSTIWYWVDRCVCWWLVSCFYRSLELFQTIQSFMLFIFTLMVPLCSSTPHCNSRTYSKTVSMTIRTYGLVFLQCIGAIHLTLVDVYERIFER